MMDAQHKTGFTIVELLIVIVVIAILAAISIATYKGIQGRAYAATVQTDLTNALKKVEVYRSFSDEGTYPLSDTAMKQTGVTFSRSSYDAVLMCFSYDGSDHWGLVVDAKDGKSYYISDTQRTVIEYTQNKVVGNSGGITCPRINVGSWWWILQTPTGTWAM